MAASTTDTPLQNTLQQEYLDIRARNPHASDQEVQDLWSQRILEMNAELQAAMHGTFTASRPPTVPRSFSHTGQLDPRQNSELGSSNALDRDINRSSQSAPAQPYSPNVYSNYTGFASQYPQDELDSSTHQEWTSYTLSNGFGGSQPSSPFDTPGLRVYDPDEFVQAHTDSHSPGTAHSSSPIVNFATPAQLYPLQARCGAGSSPTDSQSGPDTPTSVEFAPGSIMASQMSRDSTSTNTSCDGAAIDMLRIQSSMSAATDVRSREDSLFFDAHVKPETTGSHFFSPSVVCTDGLSSVAPVAYGVSVPYAQSFSQSELDVDGMIRSISYQSAASGTSSQSRSLQRKQEILASSTRPLAPKGGNDTSTAMTQQSSKHKMFRIQSSDGSSKDVAQISKAPYIRPQHPKIICPHCNEYPEGFRGEHELRRHVDRKHAKVKKVWVTVDSSVNQTFLANCKQCRNRKEYGAYYNAAAHLRRAHFHPRKRGRKGKHDSEKRGGKGGGDDPPMDYLKQNWMKEIEVIVSDATLASNKEQDVAEPEVDSQPTDIPYNYTEPHAMGNESLPQLSTPQLVLPLASAITLNTQSHQTNPVAVYAQPNPTAQLMNDYAYNYNATYPAVDYNTFTFNNQPFDQQFFDYSQQ